MSVTTFTGIVEKIIEHLEWDDNEEIRRIAATGISIVEIELFNDPLFWQDITKSSLTGVRQEDNKYLHELPQDWIRNVKVYNSEGCQLTYTEPKQELGTYEYSIINQSIETTSNGVVLYYVAKTLPLSEARDTTALSQRHGNILYYGALRYVLETQQDPAYSVADNMYLREIEKVKKYNHNLPPSAAMTSDYV